MSWLACLDFIDPRPQGTAAFGAAQENRFEIIRLLHQLRADLDKQNTEEGETPAHIAAQKGYICDGEAQAREAPSHVIDVARIDHLEDTRIGKLHTSFRV